MGKNPCPGPRGDDVPVCTATIDGHYCGKRHLTRTGLQACTSHVRYDRDSYVKGQDRKKLPEPRPCAARPRNGATVCKEHGGKATQVERAAARRVVTRAIEAETAALLAAEGLEGVADPVGEIGRLTLEALALKRALGARVNSLDQIRYTGGLEKDEVGQLRGTGTEQTRAEVLLYERALDRSMRFLEIVAKHAGNRDVDDTKAMLAKLGEALGIGA